MMATHENSYHPAAEARPPPVDAHAALTRLIARLRRRWRLRLLLDGLFWSLLLGGALIGFEAWLIHQWHFSEPVIALLRLLTVVVIAALLLFFCLRPLRRTPRDAQVALYFEEHRPELKSVVSSALDARRADADELSPALVRGLAERALEASRRAGDGEAIERPALRRLCLRNGLLLAALVGLALWRPGFLEGALPALLQPWADAAEFSPYRIELEPGDIEIARGADLLISARIAGFDGAGVTLHRSADGGDSWQQAEMAYGEQAGNYETFLFDLAEGFDYYVSGAGQQSSLHRITVADIPAVAELELRYHFPAYTGLEPELVIDGGDISALRGTRVEVMVRPTIGIPGGELLLDDGGRIELAQDAQGRWIGEILVSGDSAYRVRLQRSSGIAVDASPQYRITALDDMFPSISILSPGRDTKVSMIEEPLMQIRASDDLGIAGVELVMSVNGEPEQVVPLFGGGDGAPAERQVEAEHVIMLEDLELRPGDLISYYVNARDRAPQDAGRTATSDIFFYQVRPFDASYRSAEQRGGGGGGGGGQGGQQGGFLSEQQKQFVVATFKMIRDRADYDDDSYRENLDLLARAEARIRDRVEAIVRRIGSRALIQVDERYRIITEELPKAAQKMVLVEASLRAAEVEQALADAQIALTHLQRADAVFREMTVSLDNRGNGSGGSSSGFEDLANLFQLEMDKLRNQYETVQHGQPQRSPEALIDETLDKLRELARRQQRELERRLRAGGEAQNEASRERQLALAQELEEMARQLQKLSRNQPNPRLQQSAEQMRRAAEAMRRAAGGGGGRDAVDQARQAAENLREAERLLDRGKLAQFGEALERTLKRAQLVEKQQSGIRQDVADLETEWGDQMKSQLRRLDSRKQDLQRQLTNLEREISELSARSRQQQPRANEALKQAIRASREHRLHDRIRRTREMLMMSQRESALDNEAEIQQGLARMRAAIESALANLSDSENRDLQRSLEQMRALARELRYLRERGAEARAGEEAGGARAGSLADGQGGRVPDELQDFAERAGRLRGGLISQGVEAGEIDPVLNRIEALAAGGRDAAATAALQEAALRALMELEFKLRQQLERHEYPELLISDPGEIPDDYRALVADYFRSLSEP